MEGRRAGGSAEKEEKEREMQQQKKNHCLFSSYAHAKVVLDLTMSIHFAYIGL